MTFLEIYWLIAIVVFLFTIIENWTLGFDFTISDLMLAIVMAAFWPITVLYTLSISRTVLLKGRKK